MPQAPTGLIQFTPAPEVVRQETAAEQAMRPPPPVLQGLATHVQACWTLAQTHKTRFMTERIADCQRRREGKYDEARLAEFRANNTVSTYLGQTGLKCRAARSWIKDVIMPATNKPWGVEPTPVPDLPRDVKDQIEREVMQQVMLEYADTGTMPAPEPVNELALQMREEYLLREEQEAKRRASAIEKKIDDLFIEGGLRKALQDFIDDLTTYPSAIIKGPEVVTKKRAAWDRAAGTIVVKEESIPTFRRVAPEDIYPSPQAAFPGDGFMIERRRITRKELQELKGAPGYNTAAINLALQQGVGAPAQIVNDTQRATAENKDLTRSAGTADERIEVNEYWGAVTGAMLIEWGLKAAKKALEPEGSYDVCVVMVGNQVIKAMLNPDPLGIPPYFMTSYEKVTGSIWGKAIPEVAADIQDAINATLRAMLNNLGFASGPQLVVDFAALDPSQKATARQIHPYKVWLVDSGTGTMGGQRPKPIDALQITPIVRECADALDKFQKLMDDHTGIPAYTYGNEQVGGAGDTASGLSMLMNAASKGIRAVISNAGEDVVEPLVRKMYTWVMLYVDDPSLKGDAQVNAQGLLAQIMRDELQNRRMQFMTNVLPADPEVGQIIGLEGKRKLLEATSVDLEVPGMVPSEDQLERRIQQQAQSMMQQGAPGQPPPADDGQQPPPNKAEAA